MDRAPRLDLRCRRLTGSLPVDLEHRGYGGHGSDDDAQLVPPDVSGSHTEGVVATTLSELVEGEPVGVVEQGPNGLDQELVRLEPGRVRAAEELIGGNLAAASSRRRDREDPRCIRRIRPAMGGLWIRRLVA